MMDLGVIDLWCVHTTVPVFYSGCVSWLAAATIRCMIAATSIKLPAELIQPDDSLSRLERQLQPSVLSVDPCR